MTDTFIGFDFSTAWLGTARSVSKAGSASHMTSAAFSQRDQLFAKMGQMFFHEKMLFHRWAANEAATLSRITIPKIRLGPSAPFDARFRLSAAFHSRVFLCKICTE
jgi:hypothetical protein